MVSWRVWSFDVQFNSVIQKGSRAAEAIVSESEKWCLLSSQEEIRTSCTKEEKSHHFSPYSPQSQVSQEVGSSAHVMIYSIDLKIAREFMEPPKKRVATTTSSQPLSLQIRPYIFTTHHKTSDVAKKLNWCFQFPELLRHFRETFL